MSSIRFPASRSTKKRRVLTMPIYALNCRECGHHFETLYFKGIKIPDEWTCPQCESRDVEKESEEPLAMEIEGHGSSCKCCF